MTIYAKFDADGFAKAFYDTDFHEYELPVGAVEITRDDWLRLTEKPFTRKWLDGKVAESDPLEAPVDLAAYAAQKRWEKEVGGIEVNGLTVATDDRSKTMISGARVAAMANPDFTTAWKGSGGEFVPLDTSAVVAISDAVLAHVSSCFAIEAQVLADIVAGAITTVDQIDAAFAA